MVWTLTTSVSDMNEDVLFDALYMSNQPLIHSANTWVLSPFFALESGQRLVPQLLSNPVIGDPRCCCRRTLSANASPRHFSLRNCPIRRTKVSLNCVECRIPDAPSHPTRWNQRFWCPRMYSGTISRSS